MNTLLLYVAAFVLLPTYLMSVVWWRVRFNKWVWVNPVRYASYATKDWVSYALSSVVWWALAGALMLIG